MFLKQKYVFVVGGSRYYYEPFQKFGEYTSDRDILKYPENVALVLFTGGEDVSPELYNHIPSRLTYCSAQRDKYEVDVFNEVLKLKLPMTGVCRGSQFLCVMAGGTLFQHVTGHGGTHKCRIYDGRVIEMSSTHHQMQNPPKDAQILAWAEPKLSNVYIGSNDEQLDPPEYEYECVHYPNINAVGMQYHPEMMSVNSNGFKFASELIDSFLVKT